MATVGRVVVLLWADVLALYAMYVMMAYLTNVFKFGFVHATTIVCIYWGLVAIAPLLLAFIVDTIMGTYRVLLLSSIAYSVGMGLLAMSTPPVLANSMGTCSEYKPECIGHGQEILFYIGLGLTGVGMSGHTTSLIPFLNEQLYGEEFDVGTFWRFFYNILATIIISYVAVFGLPYIKPWSLRFGIPAICSLVATLLFISGSCSYKYFEPIGSPLTMFVRVFVATISKLLCRTPSDPNELYEIQDPRFYTIPHTRSLRFLDKAAIVKPTPPLEEQEKNMWRLCTVTEVEETKTILRMIPVWITFIFSGVVSSIGLTFFIEQADHLDSKVGRLKVPSVVLLLLYDQAQKLSAKLYVELANSLGESGARKYGPPIGIAISMVLAILCCVTAAKVENRRLGIVHMHGLVDKPDETVPMTMFWLLPQFLLLGTFHGFLHTSAICFFVDQSPVTTRGYLPFFISGVFGVGVLCSILSVFFVGKVSESGGKTNWFQHDLNASRLDKYYWTLACLSGVNLVLFAVVGIMYRYKESELERQRAGEFAGTSEPFEEGGPWCFFCC